MSGKRAWSPPRSRRPSTAAETSGWPPSCRPELGGDLSAGAAPVSRRVHPVGGHPVAAGEDAGRHAGTRLVSDVPCTILVRPGHGRQNRGAHVTQGLLLGWALSRPPILRDQGGPGVGQVRAAPRCPLEGRLGLPTEQALNGRTGLLG